MFKETQVNKGIFQTVALSLVSLLVKEVQVKKKSVVVWAVVCVRLYV